MKPKKSKTLELTPSQLEQQMAIKRVHGIFMAMWFELDGYSAEEIPDVKEFETPHERYKGLCEFDTKKPMAFIGSEGQKGIVIPVRAKPGDGGLPVNIVVYEHSDSLAGKRVAVRSPNGMRSMFGDMPCEQDMKLAHFLMRRLIY